jgi:hypothetical protein
MAANAPAKAAHVVDFPTPPFGDANAMMTAWER